MFGYSSILILFMALTALHAAPPSDKFQLFGSRYFYIEKNETLDWFEAARTCRRIGGKLATIQSLQELYRIGHKLDWSSKYWLSLNDLAHEGSFYTLHCGNPAPFLKWMLGQPDNYNFNQHCVQQFRYNMYDSSCHEKARFICEKAE